MQVLVTFFMVILTFFAVSFAADCDVDGHKFNKGEKYAPPGQCIQYTCGGVGAYSTLACIELSAPDYCKYVPEDLMKPYPECCPRYDC